MKPALLFLTFVVATLTACAPSAPSALATLDGTAVSAPLYDVLLSSARHRAQAVGETVDPAKPGGARRLARLQAAALRETIQDAAIERLARGHGVTVTPQDVASTIHNLEQALAGEGTIDGQLAEAGLSRSDFATLTRYRLLQSRLRARDPKLDMELREVLAGPAVQVYASPCGTDHRYPACLDAVTNS